MNKTFDSNAPFKIVYEIKNEFFYKTTIEHPFEIDRHLSIWTIPRDYGFRKTFWSYAETGDVYLTVPYNFNRYPIYYLSEEFEADLPTSHTNAIERIRYIFAVGILTTYAGQDVTDEYKKPDNYYDEYMTLYSKVTHFDDLTDEQLEKGIDFWEKVGYEDVFVDGKISPKIKGFVVDQFNIPRIVWHKPRFG